MTEDQTGRIEAEATQLWSCGLNIEALLNFMRDRGLNQPRSVDALVTVTGIDRGDAQLAVLQSATWKDQYERNLLIQEDLAQALIHLSEEDNPGIRVVLGECADDPPDVSTILNRTCKNR